MPTIYSIYRITNLVNGKVYIGQTSRDPELRFEEHIKQSRSKYSKHTHLIHKAIAKYGEENFKFDVIFVAFTHQDICDAEKYFIKEYDCCTIDGNDKGYNYTRGGEGFDSETFKKLHAELTANGQQPWQKDAEGWSEMSRNNALRQVEEGRHPWAGEAGRQRNREAFENGTHPFIGSYERQIAAGKHISQQPNFKENIRQIQYKCMENGTSQIVKKHKCPYCGFEWVGLTHIRLHYENCKQNPKYDPTKDTLKQWWEVIKPSGEKIIIYHMQNFCKENNLWPSAMSQVAAGKQKAHKGYTCKKIEPPDIKDYLRQIDQGDDSKDDGSLA